MCGFSFLFLYWVKIADRMCQSGKILRKIMREKAKSEVGDKDPIQAKL